MISNPVTLFADGGSSQNQRSFVYEGGSKLYHFSPKDNKLSETRDNNVVFFANDVEHAKDVLVRMVKFTIECAKEYQKYCDNSSQFNSNREMLPKFEAYLKHIEDGKAEIIEAPMNQFYIAGWASNDTIH